MSAELAGVLAQSMAEVDALEGVRPGGPPPASKHVVRALPRERLTEERLRKLGGPEARCSVCRWKLKRITFWRSTAVLLWQVLLCSDDACCPACQLG